MGARIMVSEDLLKRLRSLCPAKVRVINASDEERFIAVPTRRKKWGQVVETIDGMPWVRCELMDRSGAILGYVENDGPATDLEDVSGPAVGERTNVQGMVRIVIDAQRQALTFRDRETTEILKGVGDIMRTMTDAVKGLAHLYAAQAETAAMVAHERATLDAGGTAKQVMEIIEASPQVLAQLAPVLQLLLAKKAKGAPKVTQ